MNELFQKHETFLKKPEILSLQEYLDLCKTDKLTFANTAERMLAAIGESVVVDTSTDPRFSRIFSNKKLRTYEGFSDFFGIEDSIERLVAYFRQNAQGLEESKQILYLKGPVGSSKSSIVERLKTLMQKFPVYVLYDETEANSELKLSPVFESPLGLFVGRSAALKEQYGIPERYVNGLVPSGWLQEKLVEFDGDITKFKVMRIYPNKDSQICIMKVEPGDENNQDISVLVGKTDIRKIEQYQQESATLR